MSLVKKHQSGQNFGAFISTVTSKRNGGRLVKTHCFVFQNFGWNFGHSAWLRRNLCTTYCALTKGERTVRVCRPLFTSWSAQDLQVITKVMRHGSKETMARRRSDLHNWSQNHPKDQQKAIETRWSLKNMRIVFFGCRSLVRYVLIYGSQTANKEL